MMQITISAERSFGQLLYDLGFKYLCDGKHSYSVSNLDSKIIGQHLIKNQALDFPIFANKQDKEGRNFLTNPGIFIPPNLYYFFKEAKYRPDEKTIIVRVNIVKGEEKKNSGIKTDKGYEKEMMVEEIRLSIADHSGGIFKIFYRAINSVSQAYTICK